MVAPHLDGRASCNCALKELLEAAVGVAAGIGLIAGILLSRK
jgi:ElaB/YqjD/DUF883 family membrane-anchored ribosome-binding protein